MNDSVLVEFTVLYSVDVTFFAVTLTLIQLDFGCRSPLTCVKAVELKVSYFRHLHFMN